jgi:hypothetical protein
MAARTVRTGSAHPENSLLDRPPQVCLGCGKAGSYWLVGVAVGDGVAAVVAAGGGATLRIHSVDTAT